MQKHRKPIPCGLQGTLIRDCHRWALTNGRRDGTLWRVPIDAERQVAFPLASFDGTAPPEPFPFPLPVENSPLFVYAVFTDYCEEAGGKTFIPKLEILPAWKAAVKNVRHEAARILWLMRRAKLPRPDIRERLSNPVLFDRTAENILAAHGLSTTPGTQRYLLSRALTPKQKVKSKNGPTRGLKVVSVCLAPRAFSGFQQVIYQDGTSELVPTLLWNGDVSGDVVTQVQGSSQWDGNTWRDVPGVVTQHRERWFKISQVIEAGDGRGGSETSIPIEAQTELMRAIQQGRYEPGTPERRATRDELLRICQKKSNKTLDGQLIKKQMDSIAKRWIESGFPTNL